MTIKIIKTALFVTVMGLSIPQMASAETLDEALSYAVQNHPAVLAARAGRDGVAATVKEEKSAYYPTATANLSFGRIYADNTTTRGLTVDRGAGYSWFGEGRGAINQTLYDWSQTKNRVKAARARYHSAESILDEQIQNIKYDATQAYIQVLRAQNTLAQVDEHLKSMHDYTTRISTLVDNDGADDSELSRARDILVLAENARVQAESDLDIARAAYIQAVGRAPEGGLSEPSLNLTALPDLMVDAVDMALARHPQIAAANMEAEAAGYDSAAVSKNMLPEFDGELSYQKRDQRDLIGGELVDARATVNMNWNYAFGGAQKAAQQRAMMQQQEAMHTVDAIRRTVEQDVRVAWSSYDLSKRQKLNEYERMQAARETLETYVEQYEGGRRTLLDLMTAEMQSFNALYAYTNLTYSEMAAAYALVFMLGQDRV